MTSSLKDATARKGDVHLLQQVNLGKEERRGILLANQSDYTMDGIEKALRVSYNDIHECERSLKNDSPHRRPPKKYGRKGG